MMDVVLRWLFACFVAMGVVSAVFSICLVGPWQPSMMLWFWAPVVCLAYGLEGCFWVSYSVGQGLKRLPEGRPCSTR